MAEKKTLKDYYNEAIKVVKDAGRDDLVEFLQGRVEVLEKKTANRKPTAKQEENEVFKVIILEVLENAEAGLTIKDIVSNADGRLEDASSTAKMSALLSQLRKDGKVERTYDKKVAYFSIPKPTEQ